MITNLPIYQQYGIVFLLGMIVSAILIWSLVSIREWMDEAEYKRVVQDIDDRIDSAMRHILFLEALHDPNKRLVSRLKRFVKGETNTCRR